MASSSRFERSKGENYEPKRMNPQQPVLNVAPLNCVPYTGPTNPDDMFSSPPKEKNEAAETIGPAIIFLPSLSTKEELDNIMATTRNGVALTGAAATGTLGPAVGLVDICELEDSYFFRVSLPGVSVEKGKFSLMFKIKPLLMIALLS
ncbi:hypothetical protein DITRI_Ditri20bG0017500 [Diplodiscus trichospermus]